METTSFQYGTRWALRPRRQSTRIERSSGRRRRGLAGLTLIEVVIAMLVLAILAVAAGAFIHNSWRQTVVQKQRRLATEIGTARMETLLHGIEYADVEAKIASPDPPEDVTINGVSGYQMTTQVSAGGAGVDNCLIITVSVEYLLGSGDTVTLRSLRGPN